MKKLFNISLLLSALFIVLYIVYNDFKIPAGIKVLDKYLTKTAENKPVEMVNGERNKTIKAHSKIVSVLPAYFWDTKMLIW